MKRISLLAIVLGFSASGMAQTLNINSGQVTVAVPAAQAGDMVYDAGRALTVMGRTYDLAAISSMTVDDKVVKESTVSITYSGETAHVLVAGDVARYLTITANGADVNILADASLDKEVTYVLSGTSADGTFFMDGEIKSTVVLDGLTLTNRRGAAIDIANGKRINVVLADGTTTTLEDAAGGTHKACFFVNGHPEFSGTGRLVLTGNTKHAFASDEYTMLPQGFGTIEVKSAVGDGLHVEQYFEMRGGTVLVNNTGGDCIYVSVTKDPADEWNGQALISGGSITMDVAADDVKGLKSDSLITISGGAIVATVSGDGTKGISAGGDLLINQSSGNATSVKMTVTGTTYMPDDPVLESKCRGIKVKGDFTFDGGVINISATGYKSKAISVDGDYIYKSGSLDCAVDASNT